MSFAQFTDAYGRDNAQALTPGYQWQVRVNDLPRDPYVNLDHILNPWGTTAMPVHLRLEESSVVELTIRNVGVPTGVQTASCGSSAGALPGVSGTTSILGADPTGCDID